MSQSEDEDNLEKYLTAFQESGSMEYEQLLQLDKDQFDKGKGLKMAQIWRIPQFLMTKESLQKYQ